MPRLFRPLFFVVGLLGLVASANAEKTAGGWLEKLDLRGLDGNGLSPDGRWVVFVFISPECPVANTDIPVLNRLAVEFAARGVSLVGVYSDPTLDLAVLRRHAADYQVEFAVADDRSQRLVRATGATYTPEALVYSRTGTLLYRGRIDNRVEDFGSARPTATRTELHDVLAALVAGQPGPFASQPGFGCTIPKPVKP